MLFYLLIFILFSCLFVFWRCRQIAKKIVTEIAAAIIDSNKNKSMCLYSYNRDIDTFIYFKKPTEINRCQYAIQYCYLIPFSSFDMEEIWDLGSFKWEPLLEGIRMESCICTVFAPFTLIIWLSILSIRITGWTIDKFVKTLLISWKIFGV